MLVFCVLSSSHIAFYPFRCNFLHQRRTKSVVCNVFEILKFRRFVVYMPHSKSYVRRNNERFSSSSLKNVLSFTIQIFVYFEASERNTTSHWLNFRFNPIRSCVSFTNLRAKDKECSLRERMVNTGQSDHCQ